MRPQPYSIVAGNYAAGLDATSGPENLRPEALTIAQNVRYSSAGGVKTRLGFEVKNAALGSNAKVDTIHTHEAYDVMFCKSGTKIYQSTDGITWYDIGVTRTASEREAFWSKGKDVFVTNKTDSFLRIAVSTLVNAIITSSTDIDVRAGDGSQFTNGAAVVYIEGDEINYNGVTTDELGSVTNIAASHAAGVIITQTSTPSGAPKGSCIGELEGSLLVGGVSANPAVLYYSAASTAADPQFAYDFTDNGSGSKLMPSDVVAIGSVTGGALIGLKKGIHYADQFQLDTGGLITRPLTVTHGVPNAFAFAQTDKRTYCLTNTKRVLPILSDADGVRIQDDDQDDRRNIDYPIRSILNASDEEQSMSFSHYDPVEALATFSVLKEGISQELVLNEDLGKWSVDIGKVFSCKTNFKKRVYAGSDNAGKIYLDNELTTDDTIPILHRIVTPLYTLDDKRLSSEYLKFTFGGRLSGVGTFTLRMYVNGLLADTIPVTAQQLIEKGLMSISSGIPLGSGTVGEATLGSGGSAPTVYGFPFPYEMLLSGETIQFEWEIFDEGTAFELLDSRLDAETSNELYSNTF